MADPWHDDRNSFHDANSNTDIPVISEEDAEDLDGLSQGHWIESGRVWSKPTYAIAFAKKRGFPMGYILLVKMYRDVPDPIIEWGLLIEEGKKRE